MEDLEQATALHVAPSAENTRVSTQAPIEAFGGGASIMQGAEAAAGISSDASIIAGRHEYDANQLAMQQGTNTANDYLDRAIHGAYNPDGSLAAPGLKHYTGTNALKAQTDLEPDLKKNLDDVAETFKDPRQKANFGRIANEMVDRFHNAALEHQDREMTAFSEQTKAVTVEQAQRDALNNFDKPNQVDQNLHRAVLAIQEDARRRGQSTDIRPKLEDGSTNPDYNPALRNEMIKETGVIYAGVVSRLADAGQDEMASNFYERHKADIPQNQRDTIGKTVERASSRVAVANNTKKILEDPALADDVTKQRQAAADIDNATVRAAVLKNINTQAAQKDKADKDETNKLYNGYVDAFLKNKGQGSIENMIPPSDWEKLAKHNLTKQLLDHEQPPPTGPEAADISLIARKKFMRMSPEDMKAMPVADFDKLYLKMGSKDRSYTIGIYRAAQKGNTDQVQAAQGQHDIGMGILDNTKEKDPEKKAQLVDKFHATLDNFKVATGKEADPEKAQAVADDITKQHILSTKPAGPTVDNYMRQNNIKSGADIWKSVPYDKRAMVEKIATPGASDELKGRFLIKMMMKDAQEK